MLIPPERVKKISAYDVEEQTLKKPAGVGTVQTTDIWSLIVRLRKTQSSVHGMGKYVSKQLKSLPVILRN